MTVRSANDANAINVAGIYLNYDNMDNMPTIESRPHGGWGALVHFDSTYSIQLYCGGTNTSQKRFIRNKTGATWFTWVEISYDIPNFYKDYTTISALSNNVGSLLGIKVVDVNESLDWVDTGIKGGICLYWMGSQDSYTNIFTFNFWSGTITDLEWNVAFDRDMYVQKGVWETLKLKGGYKALVIGLR